MSLQMHLLNVLCFKCIFLNLSEIHKFLISIFYFLSGQKQHENISNVYFCFTHCNFDVAPENEWYVKIDKSH